MKSDANKGISLIEYNTYLNKVKQVTWSDGRWLKLNYDGGGSLIKKENSAGESWNYVGDLIYKNGNFYSINIPEGRAVFENNLWNYEFDYRDIWGNLRVSFSAENGQLTLKQKSDYDALGYIFNQTSGVNKNLFQYQKQQRIEDFDLNIDFFKFRPSDPTIGRFWMVDPLSSQYPHNSVYALQENKFGMGVELEGKELQPFYPSLQGELYRSAGVNSSTDAQKVGGDLLKSYLKAYATVLIMAAPVEELVVGGLLSIGIKAEATFAKEAAIIKTEVSAAKEAVFAEKSLQIPTIKEQANSLVPLNNGKSRVTLRSEKSKIEIDLKGESHFDKKTNTGYETPHTKISPRNYQAPSEKGPIYNTSEKAAQYSNTSQNEIRTVRRYLEKKQ